MKPRFLLDEHMNRAIQRQLRHLDSRIEVLAIGDPDAPPIGVSDPEILMWLEAHTYLLVTENRSTMPVHFADHLAMGDTYPAFSGSVQIHGLARIINELYLIWMASTAEEYQDALLFMPL